MKSPMMSLAMRTMNSKISPSEDFSNTHVYNCEEQSQWTFFRRNIGDSRNKEMKQLFDLGFGIHRAGMLRSDRNVMERMFGTRAIKVSDIDGEMTQVEVDIGGRFSVVQRPSHGKSTCLLMQVRYLCCVLHSSLMEESSCNQRYSGVRQCKGILCRTLGFGCIASVWPCWPAWSRDKW
jgi:hypothetical protein